MTTKLQTREAIQAHLLGAIANAKAQIKRIDQGTDPDLPDSDEQRAFLRNRHEYTLQGAYRVLSDMNKDLL